MVNDNVTHAYRVELNEFGKHAAELTLQVVVVLLHLLQEVFSSQQSIEMRIRCCVDIGWEMGHHVVDSLRHQLFVNLVEQVLDEGRVLLQGVGKGIADGCQFLIVATLEQHKNLVLNLQVGEG